MLRATKLPWVVALFAPALSCTLLVQFHDQDGGGGSSGGGGPPPGDDASGQDVTTDAGADVADSDVADVTTTDTMPTEDVVEVDTFAPCNGKQNGWYCGNNGLDDLLPDADLVYCSGGGIGSITVCDAGCLHVVDPFPDSCNPCGGVANGDYCGRDFAGFNTDNADILIGCTGGQVELQDACVHGCGSNGTMSACYP